MWETPCRCTLNTERLTTRAVNVGASFVKVRAESVGLNKNLSGRKSRKDRAKEIRLKATEIMIKGGTPRKRNLKGVKRGQFRGWCSPCQKLAVWVDGEETI